MDPATIVRDYVVPHWAFFVASLSLGILLEPFKRYVWSKHRAAGNRVVWWVRAFLPFHAALLGATLGLIGWYIWGPWMVSSPGVVGPVATLLYYGGAGALSSWVFASLKYVASRYRVTVEDPEMPRYPGDPGDPG